MDVLNNLAIIQARMDSSRLPGKVLKLICEKTVLEHVIDRVRKSQNIDDIVIASSLTDSNIELVSVCSRCKVKVFCGSENDVLDRYYQIAKIIKPRNIVRITADCPLIDYKIIDQVIESHVKNNADYTSNTINERFPDGEDVEIFTFNALESAWNQAKLFSEREHVTPFIKDNPSLFKILSIECENDYSSMRWTLDELEDYEFISLIYKALYKNNPFFGMYEILNFLKSNKDILKINAHILRNEGYYKSIKKNGEEKK